MQKVILIIAFFVGSILLLPTMVFSQTKEPITNYAEWSNSNVTGLYYNCITALHLANYIIDPVKTSYGKDLKLIVLEEINQIQPPDFKTSYSMNILVYNPDANRTAIHIIISDAIITSGASYAGKLVAAEFNAVILNSVNEFINQLEAIQGKSTVTKTTMIDIQY
jgi:hypothetical protein